MKKLFNEKGYLLGIDQDNKKVYLQTPSWDCGWYWGFGYIQQYNNRGSMVSHIHFNGLFLKKDIFTSFKDYFKETTLQEKEIWTLLELMKSFYELKEIAELFGRGGSHITANPCKDILKDENLSNKINKVLIPAIFEEIKKVMI